MKKILICLALTFASTLSLKCQPKFNKLAEACSQNLRSETADRRASFLQNKLTQVQCDDLKRGIDRAEQLQVENQLADRDTLMSDSYQLFSGDQETKGIMDNLRNGNFDYDSNLQSNCDFSGIETDMRDFQEHGEITSTLDLNH